MVEHPVGEGRPRGYLSQDIVEADAFTLYAHRGLHTRTASIPPEAASRPTTDGVWLRRPMAA